MTAFWHCDSMRPMGMGYGPIPYDRIVWYFERQGMGGHQLYASVEIVRDMDAAFLAWQGEELERKRKLQG